MIPKLSSSLPLPGSVRNYDLVVLVWVVDELCNLILDDGKAADI